MPADVYGGPFGTYPDVTGVVNATAKTEIVALVAELKRFVPEPVIDEAGGAVSSPHPDFDQIPPQTRDKIRTEIDGLAAAIAASPSA